MFHYAGEWYWGVDRLQHLERRLQSLGALRPGANAAPIAPHSTCEVEFTPVSHERVTLEFYPSLRSPYSYIAMQRVFELARRYPIDLVLRPVLPMVMRGLPVPLAKRLYITLDTKREADDLGVPFGRVCDPVGRPVERCFSLYPWACTQGRGAELLHAFTRAAFAEGVDTGSDRGLRRVVERAGLSWNEARTHLDARRLARRARAQSQAALRAGSVGCSELPDRRPRRHAGLSAPGVRIGSGASRRSCARGSRG